MIDSKAVCLFKVLEFCCQALRPGRESSRLRMKVSSLGDHGSSYEFPPQSRAFSGPPLRFCPPGFARFPFSPCTFQGPPPEFAVTHPHMWHWGGLSALLILPLEVPAPEAFSLDHSLFPCVCVGGGSTGLDHASCRDSHLLRSFELLPAPSSGKSKSPGGAS